LFANEPHGIVNEPHGRETYSKAGRLNIVTRYSTADGVHGLAIIRDAAIVEADSENAAGAASHTQPVAVSLCAPIQELNRVVELDRRHPSHPPNSTIRNIGIAAFA
jgi:hypothetical protein